MQNMGILWIFAFGMLGTCLLFTQYNQRTARDTTVTLYTGRKGSGRVSLYQDGDEEKVTPGGLYQIQEEPDAADNSITGIVKSEKPRRTDVFSWKNIQYEVPISGGEMRKLLDDVSGYVAPRKLTALMGETGAGKVGISCVGSVGTDRGHVLADGVIECTRAAHLGRCCAR
jgi:ATP-binding cassette subfamily G (WHITE) protein 2 (SNQ2)